MKKSTIVKTETTIEIGIDASINSTLDTSIQNSKDMLIDTSKRLTIFVGNYGSGKTELALNTAIKLKKTMPKVMLVDLDIVNPYFRSAEQKALLEAHGIEVLMPTFAMTTVDIPALPAAIMSAFERRDTHVIFDVGGDDVGATALGRYFPYFNREPCQMPYVINANRPLSQNSQQILRLMERIQTKSRLKISALINNSNVAEETQVSDLINGQKIIEDVAEKSNLPIGAICGMAHILDQLPSIYDKFKYPIVRLMRLEWMN